MAAKYMDLSEIAERWLCSVDYVRKEILAGKLSGIKLGGWKVRQNEVLRYEKEKEKRDMAELAAQRVGWLPSACPHDTTKNRGETGCKTTGISINPPAS